MDNQINRYFCVQPFVNTTTRIKGQNNVCCNISGLESTIDTESPNDFFNSQRVKEMRKKLLQGEKLKECSLCHYQESISKAKASRAIGSPPPLRRSKSPRSSPPPKTKDANGPRSTTPSPAKPKPASCRQQRATTVPVRCGNNSKIVQLIGPP